MYRPSELRTACAFSLERSIRRVQSLGDGVPDPVGSVPHADGRGRPGPWGRSAGRIRTPTGRRALAPLLLTMLERR